MAGRDFFLKSDTLFKTRTSKPSQLSLCALHCSLSLLVKKASVVTRKNLRQGPSSGERAITPKPAPINGGGKRHKFLCPFLLSLPVADEEENSLRSETPEKKPRME